MAKDPVCGMQVQTAHAPAHSSHDGRDHWFCSDRCRQRFDANPARFTRPGAQPEGMREPLLTIGRQVRYFLYVERTAGGLRLVSRSGNGTVTREVEKGRAEIRVVYEPGSKRMTVVS